MNKFQAEGSILIHRLPTEVFSFLCNPSIDPAELTPMEDRVTEWQEMRRVGTVCRTTIEWAARELDCISRCIEFEPPHKLVTQLEGDLEGSQSWSLSPEDGGTLVRLAIDVVEPMWLPSYLQDEATAKRWGQTLVDQTLENLKLALEG